MRINIVQIYGASFCLWKPRKLGEFIPDVHYPCIFNNDLQQTQNNYPHYHEFHHNQYCYNIWQFAKDFLKTCEVDIYPVL